MRTSVFIWRIDMLSGFFDEQFVPNTNKDTLRRELYQRFIPKGVPDHEVEDLLLKRRLLVDERSENIAHRSPVC